MEFNETEKDMTAQETVESEAANAPENIEGAGDAFSEEASENNIKADIPETNISEAVTPEVTAEAPAPKKRRRTAKKSAEKSGEAAEKAADSAIKNPEVKKPVTRGHRRTVVGKLNEVYDNALADDIADGKILSINGELKATTESKIIHETVEDLALSFANRTPLTATISEIYSPENSTPRPVAIYKAFRIYFDPSDFLDESEYPEDKKMRYRYIRAKLNRRIGAEIDFIVKNVKDIGINVIDRKAHICVGDRRAAMLQKRHEFWNQADNGHAIVEEGTKVEARVIAVRPTIMVIEVFGVEIVVPIEDVSYSYITDLTKDSPYKTGDYVNAVITKIVSDDKGVHAHASIKLLSENSQIEEARRIEALLEQHGTVTQYGKVVRVSIVNAFVRLDSGAVIRCPQSSSGKRAVAGDNWAVKITRAESSTGKMDGFLTYFIK